MHLYKKRIKSARSAFIIAAVLLCAVPASAQMSSREAFQRASYEMDSGKAAEASEIFEKLANDTSFMLNDYSLLNLAICYERMERHEDAEGIYSRLAGTKEKTVLRGKALYKLAELNVSKGDLDTANQYFRRLLALEGSLIEKDRVLFRSAKVAERLGKYKEAAKDYFDLIMLFPGSDFLKEAMASLEKLGYKPKPAGPEMLFEQGSAMYSSGKFREAAEILQSYLQYFPEHRSADKGAKLLGISHYKNGDLLLASSTLNRLKETDGEAAYYLGLANLRQGKVGAAFAAFKQSVSGQSDKVSAAKAQYQIAKYYFSEGLLEYAKSAYTEILDKFSGTEPAAWSAWELGKALYDSGDYDGAVKTLLRAQGSADEDEAAKCMIWAVKGLLKQGKKMEAGDLLKDTAERYPFTYYGKRAGALLGIKTDIFPGTIRGAVFDPGSISGGIHYEKYLMLVASGAYDYAKIEAGKLISDAKNIKELDAARLCMAYVDHLQGRYKASIRVAQRMAYDILRSKDERSGLTSLQVSFPLGYKDFVEKWTAHYYLDPYLIYGLIRQESRFDADDVSRSGAVGLAQIMPRTGRGIAKDLKFPRYDTYHLYNPDYNVLMGTYYLYLMLKRFDNNPYLALAAYNGGPGNVSKWLKKGYEDIDEFVESIPFSETRDYVKRVMQNYWIYKDLYE